MLKLNTGTVKCSAFLSVQITLPISVITGGRSILRNALTSWWARLSFRFKENFLLLLNAVIFMTVMSRLNILKTYKIYIGGQFPRTESGRYYALKNAKDKVLANVCLSSRKDLRNAVVAARSGLNEWSSKSAFNRGQIVY